jgi:hypothetical protein
MWLNATCHRDVLLSFDVNEMFLPTVVMYSPKTDEYSQLIGGFNDDSIKLLEKKFLRKRGSINTLK